MRACNFASSSNVPFFSLGLRSQYVAILSHHSRTFSTLPKSTIRNTRCWSGRHLPGLDVSSGPKWLRNSNRLRTMIYSIAILIVSVVLLLVVLLLLFVRISAKLLHGGRFYTRTFLWWPLRRTASPDSIHSEQDQKLYPQGCMYH